MFGKIQISGKIEVVTGMHIGGSSAFAAIGAVDSPVIKDVWSGNPMIPGSSLKGKMRSLLAEELNEDVAEITDQDDYRILRLFGSARKGAVQPSRLLFSDMFLSNEEELRKRGLQSLTEVKFENGINRATAVANPRQIERVVRGSVFDLDIIYDIHDIDTEEGKKAISEKEILEDFKTLGEGMKLLQYSYIGGNGSRGYGKVKFNDIETDAVVGDLDSSLVEKCGQILSEAIG